MMENMETEAMWKQLDLNRKSRNEVDLRVLNSWNTKRKKNEKKSKGKLRKKNERRKYSAGSSLKPSVIFSVMVNDIGLRGGTGYNFYLALKWLLVPATTLN